MKAHTDRSPRKPLSTRFCSLALIMLLIGSMMVGCELDSGPKPAPDTETQETTTAPSDKVFGVGERVVMDDVYVTLNAVTESTGSEYFTPEEGNIFVICEFTIENETDEELVVSSMMSFKGYVDSYATDYSLTGLMAADKDQLDGTIDAGKKMNGVIAFEVPADWSELEVHYTPNLYSSKDFVFTYSK
ncbi:MAG: DUF4352 domain-containing protein [Oscillospiraceae bacterium]|nr:DUF4352 domain-containing protein [Oscillospiraceae bacterium]